MMTIGIGDFVAYLVVAAFAGLMFGFIAGMREGYKMSRQDLRRMKRQMNGHKYQAGDIVEVLVPFSENDDTLYAVISRTYHLLEGDHDYQLLLPGGKHVDIDEEDIIRRVSKGVA